MAATIDLRSTVPFDTDTDTDTDTDCDPDTDAVSIVATKAVASEEPQQNGLPKPGQFKVSRSESENLSDSLTVHCQISGTAINGVDYAWLPGSSSEQPGSGSVTIPQSALYTVIDVLPVNDNIRELDETVVLTLIEPEGDPCNGAYTVESPGSATVTIKDNDDWYVNIVATDPQALEQPQENGLPKPGQFEITRYNETDLTWSLTVYYQIGGTAINGQHYEYLPGSSSQYPSPNFSSPG